MYKAVLESAISDRFSITPCLDIETEVNNTDIINDLNVLSSKLSRNDYKKFKKCIIRSSFFIQFTDSHAEKDAPKCQVRWCQALIGDPRYASYEQCEGVCQKIIHEISTCSPDELELLVKYCNYSTFNEALPIDYIRKNATPIHISRNIKVFMDSDIQRYTLVKQIIYNSDLNPDKDVFERIYKDKIQVKAYKTDRSQTGDYKTNRELRWEAHPNNFQFSYRRFCDAVETELILQICTFENVNPKLTTALQSNGLLPTPFDIYRCPITGDILKFDDFQYEVRNPEHGKADFQIGHMSPLKLGGVHDKDNIAWVSADGNRIQGNLSEDEIRELLIRIYRNRPELRV
ncbi:hypothetical protein MKD04_06025 [[Clostridium] innocuum]|nr:hypothetical protein [[Clostridium] innocuum]MCR0502977.1 hypothetical protein [[Clostridium] innocuum]